MKSIKNTEKKNQDSMSTKTPIVCDVSALSEQERKEYHRNIRGAGWTLPVLIR